LKIVIKSDILTPQVEEPNMNRYFLQKLARDMVKILKQEIKKESFEAPATDLIKSWKYKIRGKDIVLWSDHPALTGKKEDVIEEEIEREPLDINTKDIPEDSKRAMKFLRNIPNVAVIQDNGVVTVQPLATKTLKNGDWMFPSHRRSAFLERAKNKIMDLIRIRIQDQIRMAIS